MHSLLHGLALVLTLAFVSPGARSAGPPPERAILDTITRLQSRLAKERDTFAADPERFYREVEQEFLPYFDTRYIGEIVLGRHWQSASEAQRQRFIETFKDHLMRQYALALLRYDETVELVWQSTQRLEGTDDAIVNFEIRRPDQPPVPLGLSVRRMGEGAGWKIYDLRAQGVSMATNFRGQFNAVIRKDGLDVLIERLEAHTERTEEKAEAMAADVIEE